MEQVRNNAHILKIVYYTFTKSSTLVAAQVRPYAIMYIKYSCIFDFNNRRGKMKEELNLTTEWDKVFQR